MINIEASLQKLGLTHNEIVIYLFLLKKGLCTGAEIYKENELDKSSAYEAIAGLQSKKLVYVIGQNRNQKFGALPADKLFEIIEQKQVELGEVKHDITNLVENITDYAKQSYKNKNIRIIEGKDGFRKWAWDRLEVPAGSLIREISSNVVQETFMPKEKFDDYNLAMPKERVKKGIQIKALMQERDVANYNYLKSVETSDPALLKEVRFLPDEPQFTIACSLVTYGDSLSLLRKYKGEFLGLIIEDKLMVSMINSMFDLIWAQCKPA